MQFEACFRAGERHTTVLLPFDLDAVLDDWATLRSHMSRHKPDLFTRDEWAYLIGFLERDHLRSPFEQTFGQRDLETRCPAHTIALPGGPVAVWLPNNVSLLGPLALVLLSLTGNPVWFKSGSHGGDLTQQFLDYVLANISEGPLRKHLAEAVVAEVFTRDASRNGEWAARARTRLVFGSDAAVDAVHAMPHPSDSVGFSFGHRESEAWVETRVCDDGVLESLLRVFAIYGQAACTSPARVVLLEGTEADAREMRDRMVAMWKVLFPRDPEMAAASEAVRDHQWAASLGWDSRLCERHGAAFAAGTVQLARPRGLRLLPLVPATTAQALESLPTWIQTIGHAVSSERERQLLPKVAARHVKRLVPIRDMHRFGPVWDGQPFWQGTFDRMELQ